MPRKFTIQIFCIHLLNLLRENLSFAAIIVATTQKTIRISRHSNIIVIYCHLWGHKNIELEEACPCISVTREIIREYLLPLTKICEKFLLQINSYFFKATDLLLQQICCCKKVDFIVRLTNLQIFLAVLFCQMKKKCFKEYL